MESIPWSTQEHSLSRGEHPVYAIMKQGKCCQELTDECSCKKQWKLKQHQQSDVCIDANQDRHPKPSMLSAADEVERREPVSQSCFICLCEGLDESGQLPRRDCSCRGDSGGFAHLSCIVQYAELKSDEWDGQGGISRFTEPWEICSTCHHPFQSYLAIDLASAFVVYVEDNKKPTQDGWDIRKLEALVLKLRALQDMAGRLLPEERKEAKGLARSIMSLAAKLKSRAQSAQTMHRVLLAEAFTYNSLGRIILHEKPGGNAKAAVAYFTKCRDANRAIRNGNGVATAEANIAIAMNRKYEEEGSGGIKNDVLCKVQKVYEQRLKDIGELAPETLSSGLNFAINLLKASQSLKAERMLTKLYQQCHQVYGKDHRLTLRANANLQIAKKRYAMIYHNCEWELFQSLQYEEDGRLCVVKGPVSTPRNEKEEEMVTVVTNGASLNYVADTPIVCTNLKTDTHLNGKIGQISSIEKTRYRVHFEDKNLKPRMIKHENIRILFELPDE